MYSSNSFLFCFLLLIYIPQWGFPLLFLFKKKILWQKGGSVLHHTADPSIIYAGRVFFFSCDANVPEPWPLCLLGVISSLPQLAWDKRLCCDAKGLMNPARIDIKIYYQGLRRHLLLDEEPRREQVEQGCTHTSWTTFQVVYTELYSSPSSPQYT